MSGPTGKFKLGKGLLNFWETKVFIKERLDIPKIEKPGSHPINKKLSGTNFVSLIEELHSQGFSELIGNKLGIKLTNQPIIITIRGQCRFSDGKIHADS